MRSFNDLQLNEVIDMPLGGYARFHVKYKGRKMFYGGREIPKAFAYFMSLQGFWPLITHEDKPGWCDGVLVDKKEYEKYLKQ